MLELQVGKTYWCRGGDIVSIIAKSDHRKPFTGLLWTHTDPIELHFYPDGGRRRKEYRDEFGNELLDLIEEREENTKVNETKEGGFMGTTDNPEKAKLIGYKLTRPDFGGWMFLGTEPAEVGKALGHELENNEGMTAEECGQVIIEAFEITQDEIDNMPEFPGW